MWHTRGIAVGFSVSTFLFALCATSPAHAAQRSFVATGGVDNPACSLAAPCRAFGAAITATTAGGEIIVIDSGGYGPVTINKSVSIIAPAGVYAGISVLSGDGITITGSAIKVVLRGLSINSLGGVNGINYSASSSTLIVDRCLIAGMSGRGILVSGSGVQARIEITDSTFDGNVNNGIELTNAKAEISGSRIVNGSNSGVLANVGAYVAIERSVLAHNSIGALVSTTSSGSFAPAELFISDSMITNNSAAGVVAGATGTNASALVSVARSQVSANYDSFNGGGIEANALSNGRVTAFVSDSDVHANGAFGVLAFAATGGATTLRASGNRVTGHTSCGFCNTASTFETLGSNSVLGNTPNISGTVTIVTGQ